MHCYLLALLLVTSCVAVKAEESLPAELSSDKEATAIRNAEITGAVIYRHDHAAAVATDAALKIRAYKRDKRVKGWITEDQGLEAMSSLPSSIRHLPRFTASLFQIPAPLLVVYSPSSLRHL